MATRFPWKLGVYKQRLVFLCRGCNKIIIIIYNTTTSYMDFWTLDQWARRMKYGLIVDLTWRFSSGKKYNLGNITDVKWTGSIYCSNSMSLYYVARCPEQLLYVYSLDLAVYEFIRVVRGREEVHLIICDVNEPRYCPECSRGEYRPSTVRILRHC